jgi:hypothetical protein
MESAIRNHQFRSHSNYQSSHLQSAPCFERDPLLKLNEKLDRLRLPHDINEPSIGKFLKILEDSGACSRICYWLVMARIFELALFCAGHYADNGEFSAAGDLLVNPRKVLIHRKGHPHALVKQRHGRISDQLNKSEKPGKNLLQFLKQEVVVEIAKPAILPYLFEQLQQSRKIAAWYLNRAEQRMKKIADTIGFLSAWCISGFEDLHPRMRQAPAKTCSFVGAHLCRFDTHDFKRLGREIRNFIENTGGACEFLVLH